MNLVYVICKVDKNRNLRYQPLGPEDLKEVWDSKETAAQRLTELGNEHHLVLIENLDNLDVEAGTTTKEFRDKVVSLVNLKFSFKLYPTIYEKLKEFCSLTNQDCLVDKEGSLFIDEGRIYKRLGCGRVEYFPHTNSIEELEKGLDWALFGARINLYDNLTGLSNRTLFTESLKMSIERLQRDSKGYALIFMDCNGFKQINDLYGHKKGDEYLKNIADNLKLVTRSEDVLCRWGGDEFIILLEGVTTRKEVLPFISRLTERNLNLSIGIYLSEKEDNLEEAINKADKAMYCSKTQGEYKFYGDI